MASNTETTVSNLKINRLTQTQLENASSLSNTEAYWVDPQFTGDKILVTDSNGDIVEGNTAVIDGSLSMPSTTYETLTIGASGSTYIAPANGWFCLEQNVSGTNCFWTFQNNIGLVQVTPVSATNVPIAHTVPVLKGQSVIYATNCTVVSTNSFKFFYAEGDV